MKQTITRTYCFDGDICDVIFRLSESCGRYLGEYPDFEEKPRYTSLGRMWITAMQTSCPHSKNKYSDSLSCTDCGSCEHFVKEQAGDLIGVCGHESNRRTPAADQAQQIPRKEEVL